MTALKSLNQKVETWHRGVVITAGVLLLVALTVGLYTARSTQNRMRAVAHTYEVLAKAHETLALLRNAESEQRGFLITGSKGYDDAAQDYAAQLDVSLKELTDLVADNPRQLDRAYHLRDAIYERLTELRNTAQITRRMDLNKVRGLLGDESEVRLMGDIRRIHGEITAAEDMLLRQRSEAMNTELEVAKFTILISGGLAMLLGLQGFVLMRRALVSLNREAELLRQKESAETADREKSEFLANMSHEIRTPMNAVLGFAELLSGTVTTEKQRDYVNAINSSGRAMLSLINDILDLSKIEAGKLELNHRPMSVRRLLNDIEQIFSQQAEAKGLTLRIEIDDSLPPAIVFDQTRLRQILFNVVGNALKFTPRGSVTVRGETRLDEKDETKLTLLLSVADTGIGIPEELQSAVFDPFRQVEVGSAKGHGGTGLGLSITKRLTDLLNGRVELQSAPGKGTIFQFVFPGLPLSGEEPTEPAFIPKDQDFNLLRPSVILAADDVELNLKLLNGIFEPTHHRLVLANNGTEALAQAVKHQPDLVLLDIRMPDMDGREALAELRKTEGFEEVPVISVTASSMMAEELELRREFNGYIRKPFSRAQLFREVSRVLPRVEGSEEADTAKAAERAGEIGTSESELVAEKPRPEWQPLLDQLKDWEATRWPQLVKSMSTRDTASFARDLKRQGKEADCPSVVAYADKLLQQVERFQISAQETTLRGYPQLVHGVADQISA